MKVGVIGAGYWGKKHVNEYHQLGHDVFVSDLDKNNLEFCKLNFGAIPVNDYKEIFSNNEIQTVSICTPNQTHYEITLEALKAGKNILLEKPIAINTSQADEIIKTANSKNLILLIGHVFRFNNAINTLKELIKSKKLGRIYTIDISWTTLEPLFPDRDILFDLAVHPLDILDNIFETKPSGIYCTGEGFRQENAEFAILNCHLVDSFGGKDIFVNIVMSWLNPIRNRRMVIVGYEKTAIVECVKQTIQLINNQSGVSEEIQITPNNTIRDELNYFLNRVTNNQNKNPFEPDGEVGKRIIESINTASKFLVKNI